MKKRDADLKHHEPETRKIVVRVRDIFDECADSNPRWLPGLLFEEMLNHDLITEEQHERWCKEIGL